MVNSLYNNNPDFDWGNFRLLENLILGSDVINFDKFVIAFDQTGNFLFQSSQNSQDTLIIHVASEGQQNLSSQIKKVFYSRYMNKIILGTNCGNQFQIQPQSEIALRQSGISQTTKLNLTPNWVLIATLCFCFIFLLLGLMVFS